MSKVSAIVVLCCPFLLFGMRENRIEARGRRIKNIYGHTIVQYPPGKSWKVEYDFNWMQYNLWPNSSSPIVDVYSNDLGNRLPKCQSIYYNFSGIHGGDYIATYDQTDRLISYKNTSLKADTLTGFTEYLFSYDFPGRLIMIREITSAGSALDTTAIKWLTYNNRNQLIFDSSIFWKNDTVSSKIIRSYAYNAKGSLQKITKSNMLSGYAPANEVSTMDYDSSERLTAINVSKNGSPFYVSESFGYTGSYRFFTSYRRADLTITKHIGNNGLPDTLIREIKGIIKVVEVRFYDSLGNVEKIHSDDYNGTGTRTNTKDWTYYYEDIPDSTDSLELLCEIAVYPNPVKDELTVAWRNGTLGSDYTIQLYNLIGQRLLSKKIRWDGQLEALFLPYLPTGNYFITIEGGASHQRMVQKILKL